MSVDSREDLYGLPLDRFIPERVALGKALRGEKRREEASEVAALRKPSVAAWAVNQLVRTQPKGFHALLQAGDELAQAQARAAAGKGGGDALRDAARRQRDAVRELVEAAEGLLSSDGHALSQTMMERVGETLRAAAVDEEARRQVAGGCLTQELRFVGMGIGGSASSVTGERGAEPISAQVGTQRRETNAGDIEQRAGRETEVEQAPTAGEVTAARVAAWERKAARERASALKAARRAEAEASRAAARAHQELAAAQALREEAAASLAEAQTRLSAAAQRAEEADAKLTTVQQAVQDLPET